jgi:aspartyl protease family protein
MTAFAAAAGRCFAANVVILADFLFEHVSFGKPVSTFPDHALNRVWRMRTILILAAFMVGLGTIMAEVADKMTSGPALANTASLKAATVETSAPSTLRSLSIPRDARGHFQTDGRIDGQRVDFMVDTGASVVALNERSAARFGFRPSPGDYKATVTTANGTIKAARTRLAMIDIGGLVVRDVDAMVLPDEALSENLLGLSFLSKLRRFEYANGKMVLEQ